MKQFLPITIIFIIVSAIALLTKPFLNSMFIDEKVLLIGNGLLYFVHIIAAYFYSKIFVASNTQAFIRGVYMGMMIKLFSCIMVAMAYIYFSGKMLNKSGLFICMFLYLVYTFTEVALLMKLFKAARK